MHRQVFFPPRKSLLELFSQHLHAFYDCVLCLFPPVFREHHSVSASFILLYFLSPDTFCIQLCKGRFYFIELSRISSFRRHLFKSSNPPLTNEHSSVHSRKWWQAYWEDGQFRIILFKLAWYLGRMFPFLSMSTRWKKQAFSCLR